MQEQHDKESEKAQTARNPNLIEETLNSIRNNVYTGNDFDKKEDQKPVEESVKVEDFVESINMCADKMTREKLRKIYTETATALIEISKRIAP